MAKIKETLIYILIEMIPVTIGVYLGFLVSDISERNHRKELKNSFTIGLVEEMKANKVTVKSVINYHEMLRDTSRYFIRHFDMSKMNSSFFEGIRTSKLLNGAFSTGIQTGIIADFQMEEMQKINQLYAFQDEYNTFIAMVLQGILTMDLSNEEASVRRMLQYLSMTMTDIVVKEKILLSEYEKTIRQLEIKNP